MMAIPLEASMLQTCRSRLILAIWEVGASLSAHAREGGHPGLLGHRDGGLDSRLRRNERGFAGMSGGEAAGTSGGGEAQAAPLKPACSKLARLPASSDMKMSRPRLLFPRC